MLSSYRQVLSVPGALRFSTTGLLPRLGASMTALSLVMLISIESGSYALAGSVSATAVLSQAILAPQIARLVDRYGQRKIMLPTTTSCVISLVILIWAVLQGWPSLLFYLFALLAGATLGSYNALVRSRWLKVVHQPGKIHTAFAWESTLEELCYVAGPVLATVLASSICSFSSLTLVAALLLIGSLTFLADRSTEPAPLPPPVNTKKRSVIANPSMAILIPICVCIGTIFGAADVSTVAYAKELGSPQDAGVVLAIYAFGSALAGFIYGSHTAKLPLALRFSIGATGIGILSTTFIYCPNLWVMAGLMFVSGLFISPTYINGNAIIRQQVTAHQLTEGLAWMSTGMNLGLSLGSSLAGLAIDASGSHGGYLVTTIAGILTALLSWAGYRVFTSSLPAEHNPQS